ncbi:alcohol dehydrogenase catalytic domain-containing protein [Acidimicrobiia bacterium EGI L10123]|uniref:zinc-dependent alcohol dehydrogenase n=1 Tax=Salinilacustrithrix flava TaxID=2957203 RepID=UPI003D7C232D|nr:alcohol dehydrogenase catalytic domain-containing protein [Acidimicrobiia bacterium EGI L10123]
MRRLLFEGPGQVRWEDVAAPVLTSPRQALVRPLAVATCDLDIAALTGRFPLAGPYAFGHEGVAEVTVVGDAVTTVAPGDQVVVPFQISCGDCPPCRQSRTGNCTGYPPLSTYGLGAMGGHQWGGLLADLALVPDADAMLVPLPAGIDPEAVASASDNIPDGWRCVGPQLARSPGADVLVVGGSSGPSSIGLYAAGIAVALGAGRVVYLDEDADRLDIATTLGAEAMEGPPPSKVGSFPITVDASGSEIGLRCALNSTAFDGQCTSPSVYLDDPTVPMFSMYSRCCTLHTGRVHARAAIPQVLDLVARGFDPSVVTSSVAMWSDAAEALLDAPMKLVVRRTGAPTPPPSETVGYASPSLP